MSRLYAYPRLGHGPTLIRLEECRGIVEQDPRKLAALVGFEHPAASPVPTGATVAGEGRIRDARDSVMEALDGWFTGEPIPRRSLGDFDRALGRALHEALEILPADAAHEATWNFLAAVVFPDIVWVRFPDLPEERFTGRPRNALRRVWFRQEVLGSLMDTSGPNGLGEDELVGLLERSSLARNRRLARLAARTVVAARPSGPRSEWAREFYKRLTHQTGPLLLDGLDDEQLRQLVAAAALGTAWEPILEMDSRLQRQTGTERAVAARPEHVPPSRKDFGDVVLAFHNAVLHRLVAIETATGYRPAALRRSVVELGGVVAAQREVGGGHLTDTFEVLWEAERLDLSLEWLVLDGRFAGLFSDTIRAIATDRLVRAGFDG